MIIRSTPPQILVIDDERGPRESLRILLKKNYEVLCAESVDQGLRLLAEKKPDVIITDIRMPGTNGIEGLRKIREIDPHVSVIMLTGFGSLDTAQEAIRLGANDYLKKPFDIKDIEEVLRINIRRTQLERKRLRATQELKEFNIHLKDILDKKEYMAYIGQTSIEFAHDLRNYLYVMHGYTQLLVKQQNVIPTNLSNEESKQTLNYIDKITKSVQRCYDFVEMWRGLGKTPKHKTPILISEILRDVIREEEFRAARAQAQLQFETGLEDSKILADKIQVFRAIYNIVTNAIEALPETGGTIRLTCTQKPPDVEIKIEDNGCGIEPDQLHRIFSPDYTSKKFSQGTGLGLFITKKVIEDHHGSIRVESQPDKGTVFTIRLPLLDYKFPEVSQHSPEHSARPLAESS